MSDEAFTRQRRSLNIVSIALIVYFATGAEFSKDGMVISTFAITIKEEAVAIAFVWIAFFYFWWRFNLFGKEKRRIWQKDFYYELCRNEKYRNLLPQPTGSPDVLSTWVPGLHIKDFKRYASWKWAYIYSTDGEILKIRGRNDYNKAISSKSQNWNEGAETVYPLNFWLYSRLALQANYRAMQYESGTDWALPRALACVALICGLAALILRVLST